MKLRVKLLNLVFLFTAVALLSVSSTAMITGRATKQYVPPIESTIDWGKFGDLGHWEAAEFPEAWPMFGVGIGLLIGAAIGIYGDTKTKK